MKKTPTLTESLMKVLETEKLSKKNTSSFSKQYQTLINKGWVKKSSFNFPLKETIGKFNKI